MIEYKVKTMTCIFYEEHKFTFRRLPYLFRNKRFTNSDCIFRSQGKQFSKIKMFDVGHRGGGASIVLATSNDQKHPPENMIDGSEETFWTSTGLYPQEFIMGFGHMMDIQRVNLSSYNIRHIQVEKCTSQDPTSFEPLVDRDLPQTDGQLQHEDIDIKTQATYLRFIIDSGYDHFCAVHKLNISGNALHG